MKKDLWRARQRCNKVFKSRPRFGYGTPHCTISQCVSGQGLANKNGPMRGGNLNTGPDHNAKEIAHG